MLDNNPEQKISETMPPDSALASHASCFCCPAEQLQAAAPPSLPPKVSFEAHMGVPDKLEKPCLMALMTSMTLMT